MVGKRERIERGPLGLIEGLATASVEISPAVRFISTLNA